MQASAAISPAFHNMNDMDEPAIGSVNRTFADTEDSERSAALGSEDLAHR
jgi:hypothetical protein